MPSTTASMTNEVILEGPELFHTWFSTVKGSVPRDLWKYFNPDTADEFDEPEPITFGSVRQGATTLAALTAAERSQYTSLRSVYNFDMSQYQRFLSEEVKLHNRILSTVPEAKKPQLRADKPVRDWL